jgi:hypothetical protein
MQAGGRGDIVPMGEGLGSELLMESATKETKRRRITVTSSLNEISTDQLGNRAGVGEVGGRRYFVPSPPFSIAGFWTDI